VPGCSGPSTFSLIAAPRLCSGSYHRWCAQSEVVHAITTPTLGAMISFIGGRGKAQSMLCAQKSASRGVSMICVAAGTNQKRGVFAPRHLARSPAARCLGRCRAVGAPMASVPSSTNSNIGHPRQRLTGL
jgi:hypothetical protein